VEAGAEATGGCREADDLETCALGFRFLKTGLSNKDVPRLDIPMFSTTDSNSGNLLFFMPDGSVDEAARYALHHRYTLLFQVRLGGTVDACFNSSNR
jgi:hypothetical protein